MEDRGGLQVENYRPMDSNPSTDWDKALACLFLAGGTAILAVAASSISLALDSAYL